MQRFAQNIHEVLGHTFGNTLKLGNFKDQPLLWLFGFEAISTKDSLGTVFLLEGLSLWGHEGKHTTESKHVLSDLLDVALDDPLVERF